MSITIGFFPRNFHFPLFPRPEKGKRKFCILTFVSYSITNLFPHTFTSSPWISRHVRRPCLLFSFNHFYSSRLIMQYSSSKKHELLQSLAQSFFLWLWQWGRTFLFIWYFPSTRNTFYRHLMEKYGGNETWLNLSAVFIESYRDGSDLAKVQTYYSEVFLWTMLFL